MRCYTASVIDVNPYSTVTCPWTSPHEVRLLRRSAVHYAYRKRYITVGWRYIPLCVAIQHYVTVCSAIQRYHFWYRRYVTLCARIK